MEAGGRRAVESGRAQAGDFAVLDQALQAIVNGDGVALYFGGELFQGGGFAMGQDGMEGALQAGINGPA